MEPPWDISHSARKLNLNLIISLRISTQFSGYFHPGKEGEIPGKSPDVLEMVLILRDLGNEDR